MNTDTSKYRVSISKITPFDIVVIACIILLSTGLILHAKVARIWQPAKDISASIYYDGQLSQKIKLAEDREIVLLDGKMVVEIRGEKIRIKESACPRQLCVKTGWIQHTGEAIICVPFKTAIEINSAGAPSVDAVVF